MIIIAHRGGNRVFPENSIASIRHSFQSGADLVEIDVRLSRDKIPLVIHDATLVRLFSIDRQVHDLPARELAALQYGRPPSPLETLARVFERCGRIPLLLHVKQNEAVSPILDVMESCRQSPNVVWGLVSPETIPLLQRRAPSAPVLAFTPAPEDIPGFVSAGAGIIRLWDDWIMRERIEEIHGRGLLAAAMTGNRGGDVGETTAERLLELEALGLDWVLVNNVELAVRTLKRSGAGQAK
jgi:glycerophosphoryl diester phosphodiesterase